MTNSEIKKASEVRGSASNNVFTFERESESFQNNQAARESSTHAR